MTAIPPQPDPLAPKGRKKRRMALYVIGTLIVVLAIPCCGGLTYLGWRAWNTGAGSADSAISELFQALKYDDQERLENSLCKADRSAASRIRSNFNGSLKSSGFNLQGITWQRSSSDSKGLQSVSYTLAVERDGKRYKIRRNARLEPIRERGWRVCRVSGLAI